jgi:hypothetical protein
MSWSNADLVIELDRATLKIVFGRWLCRLRQVAGLAVLSR